MPDRILRPGILTSKVVDKLDYGAEVFYRRLMSVADDYGRYTADPVLLRAHCYPRRTDTVTLDMIGRWLAECEQAHVLQTYRVGDEVYLMLEKFGQRVRTASKWPDLPADGGRSPQTASSRQQSAAPCGSLPQTAALARASNTNTTATTHTNTNVVKILPPKANFLEPGEDQETWRNGFWSEFRRLYPKRGKLNPNLDAQLLLSLIHSEAEGELVIAGLKAWVACDDWKAGYVEKASKWISERMWEIEPPPPKPRRKSLTEETLENA